jgi:hypothetical protein
MVGHDPLRASDPASLSIPGHPQVRERRRYFYQCVISDRMTESHRPLSLVDTPGFEPDLSLCKRDAFPIKLAAHMPPFVITHRGGYSAASALDRNRTCTTSRPLPPQGSVYTYFTTSACEWKMSRPKPLCSPLEFEWNGSLEVGTARLRRLPVVPVLPWLPILSASTSGARDLSRPVASASRRTEVPVLLRQYHSKPISDLQGFCPSVRRSLQSSYIAPHEGFEPSTIGLENQRSSTELMGQDT